MLSELASAIEVIRGPASALYGSNAVHGTLNVLLPDPGADLLYVSGEAGPDSFMRGKLLWGEGDWRAETAWSAACSTITTTAFATRPVTARPRAF